MPDATSPLAEILARIAAAITVVMPGPYRVKHARGGGGGWQIENDAGWVLCQRSDWPDREAASAATGELIAACDPENMRRVLERLTELEERNRRAYLAGWQDSNAAAGAHGGRIAVTEKALADFESSVRDFTAALKEHSDA